MVDQLYGIHIILFSYKKLFKCIDFSSKFNDQLFCNFVQYPLRIIRFDLHYIYRQKILRMFS